jgi:hypothetical protein
MFINSLKQLRNNQKGIAPLILLVGIGLIAFFVLAYTAPFQNGVLGQLFQKTESSAAVGIANCWPTSGTGFAGTLAGQPNAIWCYTDYSDGPSTAVKGNNSWVDNFNHGLSFGKFDSVNYSDFPLIGSGYKSQLFRHGNHWMRDVSGIDQDGEAPPYDFMSSAMRPNMTFKAENGQLVIEADVATRVGAYGGNQFWPEIVITTADHPGEPFRDGAPQWQPEIRSNGTYVYETFPGHLTLGCRLQNDGGFTCAMLDDSFGGDSTARVFELSHFQCGNDPDAPYGSNYGCQTIYGGLPTNLPEDVRQYSRDCSNLDPDTNCRDRWRWEITDNRMTWFANGKKYMEHTGFASGAKGMISKLINQPVYVYFGEFVYKLGKPARMHWDRIAINPKDAQGAIVAPSAAETFCLGQPNNTCGATQPAPTATAVATSNPTNTPVPTTTAQPTSTPVPTATPIAGSMTVSFNDKPGQDTVLNGQYPSSVINWGSNKWYLSAPWGLFTTKSISFNGGKLKSASFAFISPKVLTAFDVYNGGSGSTKVTLSCAGNTNKVITVNAKQLLSSVATGWSKPCTTVTLSSSNGWDTNIDNLIIK